MGSGSSGRAYTQKSGRPGRPRARAGLSRLSVDALASSNQPPQRGGDGQEVRAKGRAVSPARRNPTNGTPGRERPCRIHPEGWAGTEGSAMALLLGRLLLGDLLGSLLLLLGHGNGSLPRASSYASHIHSPGCSWEGRGRRFGASLQMITHLLRTPMKRVVEDGHENCQGKKSEFSPRIT